MLSTTTISDSVHNKCDTFPLGMAGGGAFEYARTAYSNPDKVRVRRVKAVYDVSYSCRIYALRLM